jgi:hypothetical protein
MKARARVLVAVEAQADLKLCVKFIRIVDDEAFEPDALVFEWFTMVGHTREDARRNCIESIAYYVRCRPNMREPILGALDAKCALEVAAAIGVTT